MPDGLIGTFLMLFLAAVSVTTIFLYILQRLPFSAAFYSLSVADAIFCYTDSRDPIYNGAQNTIAREILLHAFHSGFTAYPRRFC